MQKIIQSNALMKMLVFTLLVVVGGCVTTTNSVFNKKQNDKAAVTTYVQLGLAYIEREDYERARKHLGRALDLNPESVGAISALGLVYQKEGESKLADEHFRKSLEVDPNFTRGRTYYGAYLYAEKKYQEAFEQFKLASANTAYESRSQIFTNMALCSIQLKDNASAIKSYEKSIRLNRDQPNVVLSLVGLFQEEGDFDKAQSYFNHYLAMVRASSITHSSTSLYYGILLARHYSDSQLESSYAMLLRNLYSDSPEYNKYRQLTANE